MSDGLVEDFFRHEYGRLVATLSRRVGFEHLEAVEDAASSALLAALETWTRRGTPDNPRAWLFRVAHNALMEELRTAGRRGRLLEAQGPVDEGIDEAPEAVLEGELTDDLLRMLFVTCDEAIPVESQLALALKTLCGFSVAEIALRLFTSEANVYKRLARGRKRLAEVRPELGALSPEAYAPRLPAVQRVLYLLFTEGHLSAHAELALRRELCDEALRLATLLADHPVGATPETFALLALMHLHRARMSARQDGTGGLLLLEEQDRAQWDPAQVAEGMAWLARSAEGEAFSRYHAEAGIAAEHTMAPSFEATRWARIVECYRLLEAEAPSALHRLNRAVAMAEWQGPEAGLAVLDGFEPPAWLTGSYLWAAVLADLHRRCGHGAEAAQHREAALSLAPSDAVRHLLDRRLSR